MHEWVQCFCLCLCRWAGLGSNRGFVIINDSMCILPNIFLEVSFSLFCYEHSFH
jgi:hypothetical protein